MMRTFTHKVGFFLIMALLFELPLIYGLPSETEYLGTVVASGEYDDAYWGPLPIGFDFVFFGNTYSDFYVTTNGLVMFVTGTTQITNFNIPHPNGTDNYIAPFWDDLILDSTGDIMYRTIGTAPNRKLVVQYTNLTFFHSDVLLGTMQVILYEGSNKIQIQYRSIVDLSSERASGSSATVGIENEDGSDGVLCSYNTPGYVYSGRAILFTPSGGTYTVDENALYDGVLLIDAIPRAGSTTLVSPAHNSTVGDTVTFQWEAASNASGYYVVISQNPDLSSPIHTSVDLTGLNYQFILPLDQTFYWSVYSKNSVGTVSWSEIWKFQTSSTPPLAAVPRTIYVEQGDIRAIPMIFQGGDAGSKTATVTSLPAEGTLYQYIGGIPGAEITIVPTDVTDASFNLIYSANGASGNGVGNFDFHFTDVTGTSADATYTINVSPLGIPNFMYASKEIDRVEITFDRNMADPTGKHLEFAVQDNGVDVTSTSCSLKAGDPTTIVVYVTPNLDTDHAIGVAYTKGTVTAESNGALESFDFQLAGKLAQVINFSALSDRTYGDAAFTLSATATSGLPVTFSSSNPAVVSVSGTTATVHNAGETLISATQAGDATYSAVTFVRHQLVNKALASVTISDLSHEYTGSVLEATVTTIPADLTVKVTYDGLPALPVDIGTYTVLAEVEDVNYDGSATDLFVITDLTPPVPDLATLPDWTGECSATPVAPTATDLYAGTITGTTTTTFPITAQGITVVTWTYEDGNGNTGTQLQNVLVADVTDPVIPMLPDLSGECSVTATAPITTDNCAGTITGTTIDPLTYDIQGSYVITWTFDDGNGNNILVDQNVLVADVLAPTATAPEDMITCDGTVSDIALKYVIDNCSTPFVTYTLTGATTGNGLGDATSELFNPGVTTVTYTLNDDYGNSSQYSFTVAYQVVEDVIITPTDGTLTCENTGSYQWINCADNSIVEGETSASFSPATSGEYAVILTRGECSNTSDCYSFTASGIGNREVNQEYNVYPNPAHDYVTIDMSDEQTNTTIKVVDMTGKILRMEELDRFIKTDLDISSFKTGFYLIQIHSDQINGVARLLKQ